MNRLTFYKPQVPTFSDFDRIFETFAGPSFERLSSLFNDQSASVPRSDFFEDADGFYIQAELPGVRKEDVHLSVEADSLELKASRRIQRGETEETYQFARTISLPDGADLEKLDANLKDGVLTVSLPKAEAKKPRRIDVK